MKKLCFKAKSVVLIVFVIALCLSATGATYAPKVGDSVYLGGFAIGISIDIDGVLVEANDGVETDYGKIKVEGIEKGDIICAVNGEKIETAQQLSDAVKFCDSIELEIIRNGNTVSIDTHPLKEIYSQYYHLGVTVKDKINGIGTVTYVSQEGDFAALGHEIFDAATGTRFPFKKGGVYKASIVGVKKSRRKEAGAILASIDSDKRLGDVSSNCPYGIYGNMRYVGESMMPIASRSEVVPGKAQIISTLKDEPVTYDIEIIRACKQTSRREKGIVFRVTDKDLMDTAGGIVQGMSGSPIVQNGKLVGAVTHVFVNDAAKGYGIYAEFMWDA